jgi:tetratricopeptide (TPR) repeat protein
MLTFLLCIIVSGSHAQSIYNHLCERCTKAASDSEKVETLANLASYFYALREDNRGDSILGIADMVAEESRSEKLMTRMMCNCPRYLLLGSTFRSRFILSKDDADKTYKCINKTLNYVNTIHSDEYSALTYATLSLFYEVNGQLNESYKYANLAYSTALNAGSDSVKVVSALQLGHVYLRQKEIVMAFKTYTSALDIALKVHNQYLEALTYKYFAQLYLSLDKRAEARNYLLRCLDINKKQHYYYDLIDTYILLADDDDFNVVKANLAKAEALADSIGDISSKIEAQKFFLLHLMLENRDETLKYLNEHTSLKTVLENQGHNYIDWMIGDIYLYGNSPDSALPYFINAEKSFDSCYNLDAKKRFFGEFAKTYAQTGNINKAIAMFEKALTLAKKTASTGSIIGYSKSLKDLYNEIGDYQKAYQYYDVFYKYSDTLKMYAKVKDLALLEIENIGKQKARDEQMARVEEERRHNLQYMAITVCIITVFLILIVLGMFTVSKFMIRTLGFFSFIFFFEFIILLADEKIHHMTHGEPLYVWLIKIVLLAVLLPSHHLLEEKLIHYLVSEKLIQLRNRLALGKKLQLMFASLKKKGGDKSPPETN